MTKLVCGILAWLWGTLQVRCNGRYSVERLLSLREYTATWRQMATVLLLTPVPAAAVIVIMDLPNLAPPQNGANDQLVFWCRAWISSTFMIATLVLQMKCFLPSLHIQMWHVILTTVFTVTVALAFNYLLAQWIGFPVPFMITVSSPLAIACLGLCGVLFWGRQLRADATLRSQLHNYIQFVNTQLVLTTVYPCFAFFFLRTESPLWQSLLTCALPMLKVLMKASLARYMKDMTDLRPGFIIFNVEVFHALFVSSCLQNAVSIVTTIIIIALDTFHNWRSVRSLARRVQDIKNTLGIDTSLDTDVLEPVECAMYVLRDPAVRQAMGTNTQTLQMYPTMRNLSQVLPTPMTSPDPEKWCETRGGPCRVDETTQHSLDKLSTDQKIAFIRKVLGVFHLSEFILLAEYVEVVVPVLYATFLVVVFHLPNRVYYDQLRNLTEETLVQAIWNVLLYAALELVSLAAVDQIMKRKLKFPPLRQLSFALSTHGWLVSGTLMLWVTFIFPCSMEHYGFDYTFQFKWLDPPQTLPSS